MGNRFQQAFNFSFVRIAVAALLVWGALAGRVTAQQNNAPAPSLAASTVPPIIQFNGQFNGQINSQSGGQFNGTAGSGSVAVPAGTVSITFTLYEDEQGGTALWSETDNVQVDAQGHYTALLGSASPLGLPLNLFTTGQAHWLAVQPLVQDFAEQPRVMLVGVPYAMKAADADTLGGLPASAFLLAAPATSSGSSPILSSSGPASSGSAGIATTGNTGAASVSITVSKHAHTPTSDYDNVNIGYEIGGEPVLTTASSGTNIALGISALRSNTTGTLNTATGFQALYSNNTGAANTASGASTLFGNTTGGNNTASGSEALASNTTGSFNTASGASTLVLNTTGDYNTASGYLALFNNSTANGNVATGYQALYSNTTGADNTASGYNALEYNLTGGNNTASGAYALNHSTGGDNTANGAYALFGNTTGTDNVADGENTLNSNTTGNSNTAIGRNALESNNTGSNNIAIGYQAASNVSGGNSNNIEIGSEGSSTDNGAIRVGTIATQTSASIAGIYGAGVGSTNSAVCIDSTGLLGTVNCPAAGMGTITGVTAGTGLSGGGTSGNVTLSIASNACRGGDALTALPFTCSQFATLGVNTFTGNQTVTGNVTASGTMAGGTVYVSTPGAGLMLTSPNGTCYMIAISNAGKPTVSKVACP
jgi:hypothetical protein